jgi:hypothetical protein
MLKIAALVWIVLGATLAGSLVTVVLTVPSLFPEPMKYIPIAAAAGYVVAIPFAVAIARKIQNGTSSRA